MLPWVAWLLHRDGQPPGDCHSHLGWPTKYLHHHVPQKCGCGVTKITSGFRRGVLQLAQLDVDGHDKRGLLHGHPDAFRLHSSDYPLGEFPPFVSPSQIVGWEKFWNMIDTFILGKGSDWDFHHPRLLCLLLGLLQGFKINFQNMFITMISKVP